MRLQAARMPRFSRDVAGFAGIQWPEGTSEESLIFSGSAVGSILSCIQLRSCSFPVVFPFHFPSFSHILFFGFHSSLRMGLIQVGSLFVFLTCAIATPIASRSGSIHLPKNYAALGDSFAAGLGSGHFLNSSADGSDSTSHPSVTYSFL